MRTAFIKTLEKEAAKNKSIILLTADLGFGVFEDYQRKFKNRFINVGVAEQNMMGIAAGLSMTGNTVIAYSIATFSTLRPFEQIRDDIAAHNAKVIIVGSGAGLSYGDNAFTHHAVEDIALMRSIPNMTILCPSDPSEVGWALKEAIRANGPVYLRLGKRGEENLSNQKISLKVGEARQILEGKDVAILSTGPISLNALKACNILEKSEIYPCFYAIHTLKPFNEKFINKIFRKYRFIVTIEEHIKSGGLGGIVAEFLSYKNWGSQLLRIGISDRFIEEIGSQEYLRGLEGLSPKKISDQIIEFVKK